MTEKTKTNKLKVAYFWGPQAPTAMCPNCTWEYDYCDKIWGEPYCPNCGQHLDWSSDED